MRELFTLVLLLHSAVVFSQPDKYDYPINNKGKISFDKTISVSGSKQTLFKYAQQFVANENFDREVDMRTKAKMSSFKSQIIPNAVTYQDAEQGKLFGNGFIPFELKAKEHFVITFTYKIYVKDNEYHYIFTDFTLKDLIRAGRIDSYPLEDITYEKEYRGSEHYFADAIANLKHQLKLAMLGNL